MSDSEVLVTFVDSDTMTVFDTSIWDAQEYESLQVNDILSDTPDAEFAVTYKSPLCNGKGTIHLWRLF